MRRAIHGAALAALLFGCGADQEPPDIIDLQRPSDIAFACFGDMRVTNGQPATADQEVVGSAMPVSACRSWYLGAPPEGQEEIEGALSPLAPSFVNFVLEPAKGTLAVVVYEASPVGLEVAGVIDTDPLTPGRNPVPVGTLPVGVITSQDGCQAVTANAGSCDLSLVDVASTVSLLETPRVDRVSVTTPTGAPVLAKPADIAGGPTVGEAGFVCPDSPQGLAWIAYPDCHAVAAVELASGQVRSTIRFGADGTAAIGDGELACLDECGLGAVTFRHDATSPRPVALHVSADGTRLYIGAQNQAALTVVDLDATLLPTAVQQVAVEGEVGLHRLIETGDVAMGGSTGMLGAGDAGVMKFVYAIASDNTIRVIEVGGQMTECDTQVDPRYLHDLTDVTFLSCMPVGGLNTPPRRAWARSPGIHVPRINTLQTRDFDGIPLDLALATVDRPDAAGNEGSPCQFVEGRVDEIAPSPYCMIGTFMFVSTADGQSFVINVDDDAYPDAEDPLDPALVTMPLALAHQLRDWVNNRDDADGVRESDENGQTNTDPPLKCGTGTTVNQDGARLIDDPSVVWDTRYVAGEKQFMLPRIRADICTPERDDAEPLLAYELEFGASPDIREAAFPDVLAVRNEGWMLTWEGLVSLDPADRVIDGPPTRVASARRGTVSFHIEDASRPFCRAGVQEFDIGVLAGCDPARGDTQCGLDETCYVHPDTPSSVATGMCLPKDRVDQVSNECRGLLISRRRYTITDTFADHVVLIERRRTLRTTPPEGCVDTAQCEALHEIERSLTDGEHPNAQQLEPPEIDYSWSCEPDPTRAPGPNRCVMTCTTDDQCEEGNLCSAGYCVEAPLPPARCIETLQRYQLRVGDAFTLLGESSGFLHNRVMDSTTGRCVDSTTPNPLNVGRVPLTAPPCTASGPTDLQPNPCSTTVTHSDEAPAYELVADVCTVVDTGTTLRTREVPAIRVDNPAMRFHLVEPVTTGDAACLGDAAGTTRFATVHPGLQIRLALTGGMLPLFISWGDAVRNLVVRYPAVLSTSPDGGIWVLDQGDRSQSTQGQILRIDPTNAAAFFGVIVTSVGR